MPNATTTSQASWHKRFPWWGPLVRIVWLLSIFLVSYLSLLPRMEIPYTFSGADKLVHFLAYLWLASLPFLGFVRMRHALVAALLMIVLGCGLELAQYWVPGRQVSPADMLANSTGVGVGIFLFRNLQKRVSSA